MNTSDESQQFIFICPYCNTNLECVESLIGVEFDCPICQKKITITKEENKAADISMMAESHEEIQEKGLTPDKQSVLNTDNSSPSPSAPVDCLSQPVEDNSNQSNSELDAANAKDANEEITPDNSVTSENETGIQDAALSSEGKKSSKKSMSTMEVLSFAFALLAVLTCLSLIVPWYGRYFNQKMTRYQAFLRKDKWTIYSDHDKGCKFGFNEYGYDIQEDFPDNVCKDCWKYFLDYNKDIMKKSSKEEVFKEYVDSVKWRYDCPDDCYFGYEELGKKEHCRLCDFEYRNRVSHSLFKITYSSLSLLFFAMLSAYLFHLGYKMAHNYLEQERKENHQIIDTLPKVFVCIIILFALCLIFTFGISIWFVLGGLLAASPYLYCMVSPDKTLGLKLNPNRKLVWLLPDLNFLMVLASCYCYPFVGLFSAIFALILRYLFGSEHVGYPFYIYSWCAPMGILLSCGIGYMLNAIVRRLLKIKIEKDESDWG